MCLVCYFYLEVLLFYGNLKYLEDERRIYCFLDLLFEFFGFLLIVIVWDVGESYLLLLEVRLRK